MRTGIVLFILLLTVILSVNCQWIYFNSDNTKGIKGILVSSIIEDQNHNMWFGTEQGVTHFEKSWSIWTNYNVSNGLLNDMIYQVFEDEQGNIWVATNGGGISRYSDRKWTSYTVRDGLSYSIVRAITQTPDGTMWFGTYGKGVCSWRPETGFRKINSTANTYILSMLSISDSVILIGTLNQGLLILNDTSISFLNNRHELSGEKVFSLYSDHTGDVWLGTNKGAQRCNLSTLTVSPCPDSLNGKAVYSICENNSQDLVFAAREKLYQLRNGVWSSFIPDNLSQSTDFYAVFFDNSDRGWFGSSSQGLFIKTGNLWNNYHNSTGLEDDSFNEIVEDKNHNIWVNSYRDVYCFDGQNWRSVMRSNGLCCNNYVLITDSEGDIWCWFGYNGLYKYDGSEWTRLYSESYFNGRHVTCMKEDKYGNIWIGTYMSGIFRFDGTTCTQYTTAEGLASNRIAAIDTYPDGRILVSSSYAELSIFDSTSWRILINSPANLYIHDMIIDKNKHIWLATNEGIVKIEGGITKEHFFDWWYSSYCLSIDKKGDLWAGGYNGLFRFNGREWITYTSADGLSSNYINDIFIDSNNRIWLATHNGIYVSEYLTSHDAIAIGHLKEISVYPSPFSNSLNLSFSSEMAGTAQIQIYNPDGRLQKQLNEQKIVAGSNILHLETADWSNGFYIYRIILNGVTATGKLLKISTQ